MAKRGKVEWLFHISPFYSNSLHYSCEIHPYVSEFHYICPHQIIKMNITSTIITASDGTPLSLYDVCRFLSKQQWKHILKQLKQEGIHIERIEAYEYPEVRDIKHLFIRFEKEKEDTPFYLLSPEIFSKLTNAIIQEYSSNIK